MHKNRFKITENLQMKKQFSAWLRSWEKQNQRIYQCATKPHNRWYHMITCSIWCI